MTFLLTALEFLAGSLMFSYWLGHLAQKDLRSVGDGNPGAFNLWSAAGYKLGLAGVALDFLKGYAPLVLFVHYGAVSGYSLVPVAAAPVAGHAFSPFLRFKGGKAIAVTFGVWSALTGFEVSLAYAIILAVLLGGAIAVKGNRHVSSEANAVQVVLGMLLIYPYLYVRDFPLPVVYIWLANFAILLYTNKGKLTVFAARRLHRSAADQERADA